MPGQRDPAAFLDIYLGRGWPSRSQCLHLSYFRVADHSVRTPIRNGSAYEIEIASWVEQGRFSKPSRGMIVRSQESKIQR